MSTPTVTAAITTHNRAALVIKALESVLAQTYPNLEVLVVDNGSTDGTREALAAYSNQIRYVFQENQGRAGGRNAAIRLARGDYLAFLDSDDLWLPGKLERQVAVLRENERIGLVHGQVELIDEDGRPLAEETFAHQRTWTKANRPPITYADWALKCRCLTSTVMIPRAYLDRVGAYDPAIGLEDADLYLRLLLEYEVAFIDGPPLAAYRLHPSQTANEELARGHIQFATKHLALLDTRFGTPNERLARRNHLLGLAFAHHVLLESRATRRFTLRALALDPSLVSDVGVMKRFLVSFLPRKALSAVRRRRLERR